MFQIVRLLGHAHTENTTEKELHTMDSFAMHQKNWPPIALDPPAIKDCSMSFVRLFVCLGYNGSMVSPLTKLGVALALVTGVGCVPSKDADTDDGIEEDGTDPSESAGGETASGSDGGSADADGGDGDRADPRRRRG